MMPNQTNMSCNNSVGNQSDLVVNQLAAIAAKLDSLIALKEDVAVIKAWMDDKEPQDELQHLPTDLVKEEASGDNSSDDHIGFEHVIGPKPESNNQKILRIQPIWNVSAPGLNLESQEQKVCHSTDCEVRTFSPRIKRPKARGQPHSKTIGYEKIGKQPRPPERIQRIDDALHENQNFATFRHLAIKPYKEQLTGWVAPFPHTRLEGKSFFRALLIRTRLWNRVKSWVGIAWSCILDEGAKWRDG
ncbi:hypothetical protein E3N88_40282 [Mikania micrantha]|uniref:Uncharacterized protein n=1 Tax=Mikania micrantha TaxID=192012 RepID=A0A5N6LMA6_9ASTR|nr:hypothetical protein E3N88_40282 [Mikania micrantha]